eukprot:1764249-Amphidinium_carterae.1
MLGGTAPCYVIESTSPSSLLCVSVVIDVCCSGNAVHTGFISRSFSTFSYRCSTLESLKTTATPAE